MISRPLDGRWLAAAVVVAYALVFGMAVRAWGTDRAFLAAGVPTVGRHFSDLYVFPAAATEFAHGGNPYLSNPTDPWQRTYNYPRVWLLFMRYSPAAVPLFGFGLAAAWLVILGLSWGRLSPLQGLLAGAAACSPPAMLALERGNSDLIIFLLLAAALAGLARGWRIAGWFGLFFASVLKLYPAVSFAVLAQGGWRRAQGWLWAAVGGLGAWTLLNLDEIRAIAHNTPTGGPAISYGSAVLFSIADLLQQERTGTWAGYSSHAWLGGAAAALLAGLMAWVGFQRCSAAPTPAFDRALAGFQAGALVYIATFILGSNFAYRQIFLLLGLPWLLRRDDAFPLPQARVAAAGGLFLLLWANPQWWLPLIALREIASWGLVALLACLVGGTLPSRASPEDAAGNQV